MEGNELDGNEACSRPWIIYDTNTLKLKLDAQLFGQPVLNEILPQLLEQHIVNEDPTKPLVLSFHGSDGTGKGMVTNFITESLYTKGYNSNYVHTFAPVDICALKTAEGREACQVMMIWLTIA